MKTNLNGKKSFIEFFKQINELSKNQIPKRSTSNARVFNTVLEQLDFDNVAYLSDN